jgi:hypothetical protein
MLASVGRSHHILSTCCESNALCVVVLVEASVTPRGVKLPEKCRTLQTRHGMGAPSEDHTTPPSSRTPSSSRGFSRTPAPQRSRRRRRAAIRRGGATDKHEALRGLLASLALPGGVEVPPRVPPDDH